MKALQPITWILVAGILGCLASSASATEGVSPGAVDRITVVETRCPTFSWGEDDGVLAYEIVGYVLPEGQERRTELLPEQEVLFKRVIGSATVWTPSADQCFAPGGRYVWFVRSVTELAGNEVVAAGEWSVGRYFTVPAAPSPEEMQRALDVIRRWEASASGGSPMLSPGTATATATGSGTGSESESGSAHHKSVPTASAAIRGEHPGMTGENYGIVGTASSPDGAGVAAAHLDGGADLVLDGSVDGEADTRLWEWGMDRASSTDETFTLNNSGAGRLHLDVVGDLFGHTIDVEEMKINGSTVIDDTGEWMGSGSMLPCVDCVTSAELASGAVTSTKIATGAVGASAIHSNAVTSTALADDAVTGAKIASGAIGASEINHDSVNSVHIIDGTVDSDDLAAGSVTGPKVAAGAVSAAAIRNNAVANNHLADDAVTSAEILDGSVTTADLAEGAVTYHDLAVDSVRSSHIRNGDVTAADLADGSVGSAEIADGAVTSLKIGALAVNEGNIQDWAVSTDKIEPGAVIGSKLADGAVTGSKIADGQVVSSKIATNAVNSSKVLDGTLTAADMDPTGGVYASKSAVYVETAYGTLPDHGCATLSVECLDGNDLPLQGACDVVNELYMEIFEQDFQNWDTEAQPAQYKVLLCNVSDVPQSFYVKIACVSVPGS